MAALGMLDVVSLFLQITGVFFLMFHGRSEVFCNDFVYYE